MQLYFKTQMNELREGFVLDGYFEYEARCTWRLFEERAILVIVTSTRSINTNTNTNTSTEPPKIDCF